MFEVMCPYVLEKNALSATKDVYICHEICTFTFNFLCDRFGGRTMVFCCWSWLFNDEAFLVIHSPNFRIFRIFDFCII